MTKSILLAATVGAVALCLSACEKVPEAPYDKGICYHAAPQADGTFRFNPVKEKVASIEFCAAELEGMRVRFLRLGGQNREIVGAYQGSFLFLGRAGVFTSTSLDGARWPALVRTGDGRLAVPSSVSQ